jgi:hypothetical protein
MQSMHVANEKKFHKDGNIQPDFGKLQTILQREMGRTVAIDEAIGTGNYLLNIYDILLKNDKNSANIKTDTTNR